MTATQIVKRRHHYVPCTYMRGFAEADGCLWAYRKETPDTPRYGRPESIAFENDYYAFEREDGSWDHNSFEDFFNKVEKQWTRVVVALDERNLWDGLTYFMMFGFMTAMRARGPCARSFRAAFEEARMRDGVLALEAVGKLPRALWRYRGELETVPIGINPQETLRTMTEDMKAFGDMTLRIGFEVLHNRTDLPFITSDNPVAYFNARAGEVQIKPYWEDGPIELVFPISRTLALRGSDRLRPFSQVSRHRDVTDPDVVRRVNRLTAKFAYNLVLSPNREVDRLVQVHAAKSPVLWTRIEGDVRNRKFHYGWRFGPRPGLSKMVRGGESVDWEDTREDGDVVAERTEA